MIWETRLELNLKVVQMFHRLRGSFFSRQRSKVRPAVTPVLWQKPCTCARGLAGAAPLLGNFAFHDADIFCLGIFKWKLAQKMTQYIILCVHAYCWSPDSGIQHRKYFETSFKLAGVLQCEMVHVLIQVSGEALVAFMLLLGLVRTPSVWSQPEFAGQCVCTYVDLNRTTAPLRRDWDQEGTPVLKGEGLFLTGSGLDGSIETPVVRTKQWQCERSSEK